MKKFFTLASMATVAISALAQQNVTIGIERPTFEGAFEKVGQNGITTADFATPNAESTYKYINAADNKAFGVAFYESDSLKAKLVMDETQDGGFGITNGTRLHGSQTEINYYWKIQCSDPNSSTHLHNGASNSDENAGAPNEDYTLGYNFSIPAGKQIEVSEVFFNLLVEQNASTRVRIMKDEETAWDSHWNFAANGYNQHKTAEGQWVYGWCASFTKDAWTAYYGEDRTTLFSTQTVKDYMITKGCFYQPLGELILSEGNYKLLVTVDWNNENPKGLSFETVYLKGEVADASASAINAVEAAPAKDNIMYNILGQRVTNAKGIVIMNGRKMIIK